MKISEKQLRKIIIEEIRKAKAKKRLQEGTAERPVQVTPAYLNRIIKEEFMKFQKKARLAESRRRRRRR
jgi:hypothetical protein